MNSFAFLSWKSLLGAHFRYWIPDGENRRLTGVAWKMAQRLPPAGVPLDLAVQLHWNYFNGRRTLQVEMVDWRPV